MPLAAWLVRRSAALALAVSILCLPAFAGKSALLIGINDYPHARPLKGAIHDVEAIRRILISDLGFAEAEIQMLVNEQATRQAIVDALAGLARRMQPGDAAFLYYSGHGWLVTDVDGDESTFNEDERFDEALVPYDAVPWPRERARDPNPTLLTDDEIARALGPMRGRRLVAIFDSCHAGSGLRGLPGEDPGRSLYDNVPLPASRFRSLTLRSPSMDLSGQAVFLAAAQWRQTASDLGEFEGRRHGAFTASLLRTVKEAGPGWANALTFEAWFRRARADLISQGVASQTPTITGAPSLARSPVVQFFDPPPAMEIAELSAPPAFEVYLEVNKYQFLAGEQMQLAVESERDGYLYVFDIDPERRVTQLFPNRFDADNRLPSLKQAKIPGARSRYQFTADQPYGVSTIVALVTREPWDEHAKLNLPSSLDPLSAAQEKGLRSGLRDLMHDTRAKPVEWACQKVAVEVVASRSENEAPPVTAPPAIRPAAPASPANRQTAASGAEGSRAASADDADITWEEQQDLRRLRPALFQKLEQLAERFSPVFWQDVSGESEGKFRPWKDFFVRYDFDRTSAGPNWPAPPGFQDENKRVRIRSLDTWLDTGGRRLVQESKEMPGVFNVTNPLTGETSILDLRPYVYWTVLTTPTHYFFHYAAFKAEDWKPLFGHPGDLEGCTIIVDRKTEKMVAALTLAHDDVQEVRALDGQNEGNIEVLVDPSLATRDLAADDSRPVNGALGMDAARAGDPAPKEHQDIYSETRGHGQYGPSKIHPTRYIVYANFLPDESWKAPSFNKSDYAATDKFSEVATKYKYKLIYFGSGREEIPDPASKTLWSEYRDLTRFPGGVNPPWCWRDNLFFRTGWWKDPRTILKIGDGQYRINPYLKPGEVR